MRNFVMSVIVSVYESRGWWNPWKDIRELKSLLRTSERLREGAIDDAGRGMLELMEEVDGLQARVDDLTAALARQRARQRRPAGLARKLPGKKRAGKPDKK